MSDPYVSFVTRCYTKANGNFSGGTLPLMHRVAQCQLDGLEMVPLNHSSLRCRGDDSPQLHGNSEQEAAVETEEDTALTPTHNPCRVPVDAEPGAAQRSGEPKA